ncbi:MAG: ABC transporter substrate-binding protein [Guyparkeria sp.]|uniref:ABC transporter substrate-binding protein n=1 Tax=Guyparkeria sp. TaxID=2035736 RepID=UPI00397A5042
MKQIDVGLEWFLNPDHLPFVTGIEKGWFRKAGLDVRLVEPVDHYDGLAAVAEGKLAFACNEPLHMIDEPRSGLRALGCFFETEGGVMLTPAGVQALREGKTIRVASPVAGEVTDDLAREIVGRWCETENLAFDPSQLQIEAAGFEHLKNLQAGFDGAWLCFANFEGVEARYLGVEATFIASTDVGLPNFSALELFTGESFHREYPEVVSEFTRILSEGAELCREDPNAAARIWYRHTGDERSALMDAIIRDTCRRLVVPVVADPERWREMWRQFDRMGLSQVDRAAFDALYEPY